MNHYDDSRYPLFSRLGCCTMPQMIHLINMKYRGVRYNALNFLKTLS